MRILKVKDLSVELGDEKILDQVSFEVDKGEVIAIIGPNGGGKTTLFKALLGLIPYEGKIEWAEGIKIGYVPQRLEYDHNLLLTAQELFNLINFKGDLRTYLKEFKLTEEITKIPLGQLSGGEFQKVLIAFSLSQNPDVLLFDEPTTGIDIIGEETVYHLLVKLAKQKNLTLLFISHELSIVFQFAQKVICLNRVVKSIGPVKELTPETLKNLYGEFIGLYQHS